MIRKTAHRIPLISLLLFCLALTGCARKPADRGSVEKWGPLSKDALVLPGKIGLSGKTLVTAINQEPRSFNRIVSSDTATADVTDRIFADLIHINRETQQAEPALAKSWSFSPDSRLLTMSLREGVNFSDGRPFTADDVVFTFQVIYDPKINSTQADQLKADGQPFGVKKLDAHTVQFSFAKPVPAVERLFDSIFILPKHKLEAAYQAGNFSAAWSISSDPREIAGLGPFKFSRYVPGQRVELERNPHYWKTDSKGNRLPYLSRLILMIIPNRDTQFLNFQSGNLDILNEIRAEDFAALMREAGTKGFAVKDLGPDLGSEQLWFNQNPESNPKTRRPYVPSFKLKWFTHPKFRQAISHAIDRSSLVNLVYQGRATAVFGPLSPSNKFWFNPGIPQYPFDLNRAKQLLLEAGFHLRSTQGESELRDAGNHPVRFSLLTNAGNRNREKIGALIQNDLQKLGIRVDFTPLEFSSLISKITETFDYDACLLGPVYLDTDPTAQMNVWLSSAPNHQWFPNQKKPATAWEARIDELMKDEATAMNPHQRKRDFDEVQRIVGEQLPFIYLVSRDVLVASRNRVGNFRPAVLYHHTLWNCEQLFVK